MPSYDNSRYPGIDSTVEEKPKTRLPCRATTTQGSEHPIPLKMSQLPELSIDFIGPFPSGKHSLSSWMTIAVFLKSKSYTLQVVKPSHRNSVQSSHVRVLRRDNGPPFNGSDFSSFATYLGFAHRRVTPL